MSQADIVDHRTLTINHVADLTHVTSLWWSALWTMDGKVFEVLPPRHAKQTSCHRRTTHRLTDRLTTIRVSRLVQLVSPSAAAAAAA